jgi:hypothetical protein
MPTGEYRDGYTDPSQSPQGIHIRTILIVGLVMMAAGAFIVAHALSAGPKLPPAAAQDIPSTVGTRVPFAPDPASVAAPLRAATPMTIVIPAIGVNAPATHLDLNTDGTVQVPPLDNHNLAGWYDRSVTPGAKGTSVILGHVDDYAGPSVFYNIKNLRTGEAIDIVRADGTTAVFAVDGVQKAAKTDFPTGDVYGNVPYPALRLVTCGGPFDAKTGEYLDSIVVYAHLAGLAAR